MPNARRRVIWLTICFVCVGAAWLRSELYVDLVELPTPSRDAKLYIESSFGAFSIGYASHTFERPYFAAAQSVRTRVATEGLEEAEAMFEEASGADLSTSPRQNLPWLDNYYLEQPDFSFRHHQLALPYWFILSLVVLAVVLMRWLRRRRAAATAGPDASAG